MRLVITAGALLFASGCATVQKERGHTEVAALVEERIGRKTRWNQGTPEDAQVERGLDELLKGPLTSDSAVEVALLNNPALQATYEDLGVSQADLVQAGLLTNPSLGIGLGVPLTQDGELETEFSLVQGFLELFTMPLRKKVAREQFDAETLRVAHQALFVAADVRKAYREVQARQQLVELRGMVLVAADAAAELATLQYGQGNINDLALVTEKAFAEETRLDLAREELALVEEREHLNQLMGLWGARTGWRIEEKLPAPPSEEVSLERLESRAVKQRLDIDAARKQVSALWNALELARSTRYIGRVDVGASLHGDPDGPKLLGPSLSVDLPIFDQRQALIARLEAQHRQGERRLAELSINARSEVRTARARVMTLRGVAERYQRGILPLREQVVEQSQLQYNAMQIGLYVLLEAKREQIGAYRTYIETIRDYWMARADLEQLVGGRLPGAEGAPEEPAPSREPAPSDHPPPANGHPPSHGGHGATP
ncbi:copper tolerance protein [Myxococcus stipitatus DSM 14675]|uniref:Copper tolerance protein n=1 Tax=Myxococcus stipitatus (strain DSM 14675 / JCM 12634 / Mx s8) TaxID=1278073 RepID=L7U4A1_MYXSD|nr:TolC family protein [Myxococcus stipitatus]AGC42387.1 copper tolerance protein [Myxococcus stipitatus DSM 14675]